MDAACLDLANSLVFQRGAVAEDRLEQPGWLDHFLTRWDLAEAGSPDADAFQRLRALRGTLRTLIEAMAAGEALPAAELTRLNKALADAPVYRRLNRHEAHYHLELAPAERDWNWVLAEIAASLAALLTQHDPTRVRICENPDCRWTFYDESRSRTRRWCEDACGNLVKVRRFRAKQRHGPAG